MILDSTDLLQVCLGPFAFLFPQGLQSSACLVIFLRIYEECGLSIPISPLYLNVDGVLIGLWFLFDMVSCHLILRIWRRQRIGFWYWLFLLPSRFPNHTTGLISHSFKDFYFGIDGESAFEFQIWRRVLNAWIALLMRLLTSSSAPRYCWQCSQDR